MSRKELGKIKSVRFGYWDFLFGLHLELGGEGWGVMTSIEYNPTYKNTTTIQGAQTVMERVQKLLKSAKVDTVDKLLNVPIEAELEGNSLKDFRILTEVL